MSLVVCCLADQTHKLHTVYMKLVRLISQTTNWSNARHCSTHGEMDLLVVQATLL